MLVISEVFSDYHSRKCVMYWWWFHGNQNTLNAVFFLHFFIQKTDTSQLFLWPSPAPPAPPKKDIQLYAPFDIKCLTMYPLPDSL